MSAEPRYSVRDARVALLRLAASLTADQIRRENLNAAAAALAAQPDAHPLPGDRPLFDDPGELR